MFLSCGLRDGGRDWRGVLGGLGCGDQSPKP